MSRFMDLYLLRRSPEWLKVTSEPVQHQSNQLRPAIGILDPRFRYVPAAATDIRKTWARATKSTDGTVPVHEAKFWEEAAYNNAERSNRLYRLLVYEHHLRTRNTSPWNCSNNNCPRVDKPMSKECNCFRDRYEHHMRQIAALPGEPE